MRITVRAEDLQEDDRIVAYDAVVEYAGAIFADAPGNKCVQITRVYPAGGWEGELWFTPDCPVEVERESEDEQ